MQKNNKKKFMENQCVTEWLDRVRQQRQPILTDCVRPPNKRIVAMYLRVSYYKLCV